MTELCGCRSRGEQASSKSQTLLNNSYHVDRMRIQPVCDFNFTVVCFYDTHTQWCLHIRRNMYRVAVYVKANEMALFMKIVERTRDTHVLYISVCREIILMWIPILSLGLALIQIIIGFNSLLIDARDGLCADESISFLHFLDASGNAARSNFVPSTVFTVLVSSLPYVLLYIVPLFIIVIRAVPPLRNCIKTELDPILRDGIVSWLALLSNSILKSLAKQPRPAAYASCISTSTSYGMPSGHATWAVALWVYAYRRKDSWLGKMYGLHKDAKRRGGSREKKQMQPPWGFLLWCLAVPFTRYELQYHTVQQLAVGGLIGVCIGWLGSKMSNPRLFLTRFQTFLLWLLISCLLEGEFNVGKKVPPLVCEFLIMTGAYITLNEKYNGNSRKYYGTNPNPNEETVGLTVVREDDTDGENAFGTLNDSSAQNNSKDETKKGRAYNQDSLSF